MTSSFHEGQSLLIPKKIRVLKAYILYSSHYHCSESNPVLPNPYLISYATINCLSGVVPGCLSRRAGGRCVALGHAAIDNEIRAVDKAGLVAGQEKNCLSLLNSLTETTAREVDLTAVALLLVITKPVLEEWGAEFC